MRTLTDNPQFREELRELCKKFKVTEIVCLIEFEKRTTGLFQNSTTGRSNIGFNTLYNGLEKLLLEIQAENAKKN